MSNSNQTFDITTEEGRENGLAVVLMINPPMAAAAVWLEKTLFDVIATLTSGANEKEMEEQEKRRSTSLKQEKKMVLMK